MSKVSILFVVLLVGILTCAAQVKNFVPVTDQMLLNPSPDDWLMFSRTYDAQRFSPLNQVNKQNVNQLGLAWSRGLGAGTTETIPTIYKGVMYINVPLRTRAAAAGNRPEGAAALRPQARHTVRRDRRRSRSMTT